MFKLSHKLIAATFVGIAVGGGLWVLLEGQNSTGPEIASLEAEGAREQKGWEMIRAGALIVDVRTPKEFAAGHLEGAIHVPHDQVASQLAAFGADKSRPIVLYCGSGRRAGLVEEVLAEAGFANVFNAGGYEPMMTAKPEETAS